jgi:hypothetical protein
MNTITIKKLEKLGVEKVSNFAGAINVNYLVDMFLLAAKQCGFQTPNQIENNFEIISLVAAEMVKDSRNRVITKIASNPNWIQILAAKYQLKVLNQE